MQRTCDQGICSCALLCAGYRAKEGLPIMVTWPCILSGAWAVKSYIYIAQYFLIFGIWPVTLVLAQVETGTKETAGGGVSVRLEIVPELTIPLYIVYRTVVLYFFMYDIQHCFICHPSDSTVLKDAGIEPRTVATKALAVRHCSHSAGSHPHSARSHPEQLLYRKRNSLFGKIAPMLKYCWSHCIQFIDFIKIPLITNSQKHHRHFLWKIQPLFGPFMAKPNIR
jgi:hypothetical protein